MTIGLFDSGVGGISVLKEIRKILPNENIIYVGDIARVPYGEKKSEEILQFSIEISQFLQSKGVDLIVIACNTATAYSLNELQNQFSIPIIGVINAGVKATVEATKTGQIGIIATNATVNSGKYQSEIQKFVKNNKFNIYMQSCPLLPIAVEEGLLEGDEINNILKTYISPFSEKIDTLTLGCTHFPILKKQIVKLYPNITIVDPAIETAKEVKQLLLKEKSSINNYSTENIKKGEVKVYLTKNKIIDNFQENKKLEVTNENKYKLHESNFIKVANVFLEDIGEQIIEVEPLLITKN